ATLKGTDVEARADYVPISEELRRRIAAAVVSGSSMMGKGKPSGWWPIYTDLEHPLDSWLTEETLPIIAGIKPHESVTFVEWIARLFVEIRDALRPVLGGRIPARVADRRRRHGDNRAAAPDEPRVTSG